MEPRITVRRESGVFLIDSSMMPFLVAWPDCYELPDALCGRSRRLDLIQINAAREFCRIWLDKRERRRRDIDIIPAEEVR